MSEVAGKAQSTWFAVYDDYTIKKHAEFNNNLRCIYWIEMKRTGNTYTTTYGNTHHINEYHVYDTNLQKTRIEKRGWFIHKMADPSGKTNFCAFLSEIADPNGELRSFCEGYDDRGIEWALNKLKACSTFGSWMELELNERLVKSENTIQHYEGVNSEISNELEKLKEKFTNALQFINEKLEGSNVISKNKSHIIIRQIKQILES